MKVLNNVNNWDISFANHIFMILDPQTWQGLILNWALFKMNSILEMNKEIFYFWEPIVLCEEAEQSQ